MLSSLEFRRKMRFEIWHPLSTENDVKSPMSLLQK